MRRLSGRSGTAVAVALAAACAVAVLLAVFVPRWVGARGGSYEPRRALQARAALGPRASLFGDVLTARALVLVDATRVDPATVRVHASFVPYDVLSESRRVHRSVGRAARVDVEYRLQCVVAACLAAMGRAQPGGGLRATPIRFTRARVSALEGARVVAAPIAWPRVIVRSRLTDAVAATGAPALPTFVASDVDTTADPDVLGGVLLGIGVVLGLAGGWLVSSALWNGPALVLRRRRRAPRPPLEVALALARHAASTGDVELGRKALAQIAEELGASGETELAGTARRLAWSEETPSVGAVGRLVDEVVGRG
jgi:hypothetical protein